MPVDGFSEPYALSLGGKRRGNIWQHKPEVGEDGLMLVVHNGMRHRFKHLSRPLWIGAVWSGSLASSRGGPSNIEFTTVCWEANGKSFVTGDQKGQVYSFQVYKNAFVATKGPGYPVACVGHLLHTQGREVAVGGVDGSILILDTLTRELHATLRSVHEYPVHSVCPHPSLPSCLSASHDRIALWSADDWVLLRSLPTNHGIVCATYACGGEKIVALLRDNWVLLWDALTLSVEGRVFVPTSAEATALLVSYNGLSLVVGDSMGALFLFDVTSHALVRVAQLPQTCQGIRSLQGDSSGCHLGALCHNGALLFLRLTPADCVLVFEIQSPMQGMTSFALDPSGSYLAAGFSDGSLRLFDVRHRRKAAETKGRQRELPSHAPRPDSPSGAHSPSHKSPTEAHFNLGQTTTLEALNSTLLLRPFKPAPDILDAIFGESGMASHSKDGPFTRGPRRPTSSERAVEKAAAHKGTQPPSWATSSLYTLLSQSRISRIRRYVDPLKLQALLRGCGAFPDKHRLLVWKILLRIPENVTVFASLTAKGIHPAYANLQDRYPIRSDSLLKRLKVVCSALAHWSEVMSELEYTPTLAFPFLLLFKGDDLSAFEATLSVFLHWQHGFLSTFPSPPITLLSTVEQMLRQHDPVLRKHLVDINVDAQSYAWLLLRSLFTEVLTRKEWLQLWDHLLAYAERPQLLLYAVIGYVMQQRAALLDARTKEEVEALMHRQNPINMTKLLKTAHRLDASTPASLLRALRRPSLAPPAAGPNGSSTSTSTPAAVAPLTAILEDLPPIPDPWPLPTGYYPPFDGYPKYVVDYQMTERARIALEEEEIRRKRDYMEALGKKTDEVTRAEQVWLAEQQMLLEAEEKRNREADDLHQRRLCESRRLDEMMRVRRLTAMDDMEKGAQRSLDLAKRLKDVETRRMREEVERVRQRQEYELRSREEEERLLELERRVKDRVDGAMLSRFEEEKMREMRAELDRRREILELEDRRTRDKWALEDAEREARARGDEEKREALRKADEAVKAQAEIEQAFVAAQIERDIKLTALERARRLRLLQEDQERVAQEAARARLQEAQAHSKAQRLHVEEALRATRSLHLERRLEREREIEAEQKAAAIEAEKRLRKAQELEQQARRKEVEEAILLTRQQEVEKALHEEKDVQHMMLKLQKEKIEERSHQLRLKLAEEEKKALHEFQAAIQQAEDRLIAQERHRFEQVKRDIAAKGADDDADMLAKHERRLAEIQAQIQARMRAAEAGAGRRMSMEGGGIARKPVSQAGRLLASDSTGTSDHQSPDKFRHSPDKPRRASSPPRRMSASGGGGGGLGASPSSSSRTPTADRGASRGSRITETPSLEKALNLDNLDDFEDEEEMGPGRGGGREGLSLSTSTSGSSSDESSPDEDDSVSSVVRVARRALERHRQLTQQGGPRRS